jgi:hypothetical protein
VVVAPRNQGCPRRRASCGGLELRVAQPRVGDAVGRTYGDHAAELARCSEPQVATAGESIEWRWALGPKQSVRGSRLMRTQYVIHPRRRRGRVRYMRVQPRGPSLTPEREGARRFCCLAQRIAARLTP